MKSKLCVLFLLFALALHGQVYFQKTYTLGAVALGNSVQQTRDGGYILLGSENTLNNGTSKTRMYLVKTDSLGNELWHKTFGNDSFLIEQGISVKQTSDNGYILCGVAQTSTKSTMVLIRLDTAGSEKWNKTYYISGGNQTGEHVQQTSDSGFIAVGFTAATGVDPDITILKTDKNGNEMWSKQYNRVGGEYGFCIKQTADGAYAVFGSSITGTLKEMYLMKVSSIGNLLWTKSYAANGFELGRSMDLTSDKGFILVGFQDASKGDVFMVKTDSSGNETWRKFYGGNGRDEGYSVQQTKDGGFVLAGRIQNPGTATDEDMYCVKTGSTGIVEWEAYFTKGLMSEARSVVQTNDNGYIILGNTSDTTVGPFAIVKMYLVKVLPNGALPVVEHTKQASGLCAYPNPFSDFTTIEFDHAQQGTYALNLTNMNGQLVQTIENINTNQVKLEKGDLCSGLYFYQLILNGEKLASGKLIIE